MELGSQSAQDQYPRLEQLEREGRFPELASELASLAHRAAGTERALLLARLGEARLRLDDHARAFGAFRESLQLDSKQPIARRRLEALFASGDHAGLAEEILEPIYEAEYRTVPDSASRLLNMLEARAQRTADADERLASWVQLGAVFDQASLPHEPLQQLAERLLPRIALEWPGGVAKWIERLERHTPDESRRIEALLSAIREPITDAATITELSLAAGAELEGAGRVDEARELYQRALLEDPTSPEVLTRIDSVSSGENADQRLARFKAALDQTSDPERRAALLSALAALQKNLLGDLAAARLTLESALAESPTLYRAHELQLEVLALAQDTEGLQAELSRGAQLFSPDRARAARLALCEAIGSQGMAREALELCRPELERPDLDEGTRDLIERLAEENGELETLRKIHEQRLERADDANSRARALEAYGVFYLQRQDDATLAATIFKQAGKLLAEGSEQIEEAERLYERALQVQPSDSDAAARLVELYARAGEWSKVPPAFTTLLGTQPEPEGVLALVAALEARAVKTGGADELARIVDEVVAQLPEERDAELRQLVLTKARVLSSSARFDEAARVYEALIESYADEQDVRAYVGLVEGSPEAEWRHEKRRWLFEWRAQRAEDPVAVILHFAAVEEHEFSDVQSAIELLDRAAKLDDGRVEVFRELARLQIASGDVSAGLHSLRRVRELSDPAEAVEVELSMAELLIERLDQPLEAQALVESLLRLEPRNERARELAQRLCSVALTRVAAAEALENASVAVDSALEQRRVFRGLLEWTRPPEGEPALDTGRLRRRLYERWMGLEQGDELLWVFEQAAAEFPEDRALLQALEAAAKRTNKPEAFVRSCEAALANSSDPVSATEIAQRLIEFCDENIGDSRVLVGPLLRLLAVVPSARWAFDRIKLALTLEQRWDVLFPLYDRVIEALEDPTQRAQLYDEAAIAARDVASDPERAIAYFESYFALRPDDARADLGLERLYERQKKLARLIEHLQRREESLEGYELLRSRERIAGLYLELLDGRQALAVVESFPDTAACSDSTLELLERVFALQLPEERQDEQAQQRQVARRAARHLETRYTSLNRLQDVARVIGAELRATSEPQERIAFLQQLSGLFRQLGQAQREFDALGELMLLEPHSALHRERAGALAEQLGARARFAELNVAAAERCEDPSLFADLLAAAARIQRELSERAKSAELERRILNEAQPLSARLAAARRLAELLDSLGRPAEREQVLTELADLEPDPTESRAARWEAARLALEELHAPERAAAAYRRLLDAEPDDLQIVDALLLALRGAEAWEDVIAALHHRAELEPDARRARDNVAEAARIRAERLADSDGAILAWRALRERFGPDRESFEQLSALLEGSSRFVELAELLGEEAERAPRPEPLYARLARVHHQHTLDLSAALRAYRAADDHVSAARLFCERSELVPDDPSLALSLDEKLREPQPRLAEAVLRAQIEHYGPRRPRDGIAAHLALATLLQQQRRGADALKELGAARTRYPESSKVLAALAALALSLGDLEQGEQSYRALLLLLGGAASADSAMSRAEVYLWLAHIAKLRGDRQRSEDHIASAFEAALGSEEEALGLEATLRQLGREDLLERAVTSRLERARDPAKVALALRDLLDVSATFGVVDGALSERGRKLAERAFTELSQQPPAPADAWHALFEVFEKLGEKERSLEVLEILSQHSASDTELSESELAIARRLLEFPNRREDAIKRLWQLVERDARAHEAYQLLSGLLAGTNEFWELLRLVGDQLARAEAEGDSALVESLALRLASALERAGELAAALLPYQTLAQFRSRRAQALGKIFELHEALGASDKELADALEAYLDFAPEERVSELALRLAELRQRQADDAGWERALERAFQTAPDSAEILNALVDRFVARSAYDRARDVLQRGIEASPKQHSARLRLAEVLATAGDRERALEQLQTALNAGAAPALVRRKRAEILEGAGRIEEALTELDAALIAEGGPNLELLEAIERTGAFREHEAWALRASDICAEHERKAQAREFLEPWLDRRKESPLILGRVARLAASERDFDTAIDAYRRLCRLERGSARRQAVLGLARAADAAGRPDEAMAELESALSESPEAADLRRELGKLYARLGDRKKQAGFLLDEARVSRSPDAFVKAAELLCEEGLLEDALEAVEELRGLEPQRIDAALLSARVWSTRGELERAELVLEDVLAATDVRTRAHTKLMQRLAELKLTQDELPEALELLGEAHQLDKGDADLALAYGLLAADLDYVETALSALRVYVGSKDKATDLVTRRKLARAYLTLGELEAEKGQRTVARRMLQRALECDPENKDAQGFLAELNQR